MNNKNVNICGIDISRLNREQFTEVALKDILSEKTISPKICFSLNGESLSDFHSNKCFSELLKRADYVHADGMSIVFMSKLMKRKKLPERIATTDWFHDIAAESQAHGVRHFFLGAEQGVLEKTINNIKNKYPDLQISGYHHGYFNKSEEQKIINQINDSKTDILWVALGRPKQEVLSIAWKSSLNVKWIKTCGGLFDFLSQSKKRAPLFMQKFNLEWLYRMYLEPLRLGPRYLRTNIHSIAITIKYLVKEYL